MAYRHHMLGFFGVALVSGAVIAGIGSRIWPGRRDITILAIGAVQALFGFVIYVERFNLHG